MMIRRTTFRSLLTRPTRITLFLSLVISLGVASIASAASSAHRKVLWRWVGQLQHSSEVCPIPAPPDSHDPTIWSVETIDLSAQRFCVFDAANGPTPDTGPVILTPVGGWKASPVPDGMIVQPMGTLSELQWENLQARFEHEAGAVQLPLEDGHELPRISLIDTTPRGPTPQYENSSHGESLGRFLRHFLCDEPGTLATCIFEPGPQLALGYTDYDVDEPTVWNERHGGYVGLLSQLATAIGDAVDEAAGKNLVLNLSVAWDDDHSPPAHGESGYSAPERMVLAALQKAACASAVTLAAAGNRSDDQHNTGPLLPAAWENLGVPAGCEVSNPEGPPIYQPLVYGVGGVENDDLPLPVSRLDAQPPLVAYGESAVTESARPGRPTATLSGTSVSTAVVSMAAAAVWYYFPHWTGPEVLQVVYNSAQSLGTAPDFSLCSGSNGCQRTAVHRVRVCDALASACGLEGGCPLELLKVDLCSGAPHWLPPVPNLQPLYEAGDTAIGLDLIPSECESGQYFFDPWHWPPPVLPPYLCPSRQLEGLGILPSVTPQPNSDPCPDCLMFRDPSQNSNDSLNVEIPTDYGYDVCSMTLRRCGHFHVLNVPITSGDRAQVQVPPVSGCHTATLQFTLVPEGSPCGSFAAASAISGVTLVP